MNLPLDPRRHAWREDLADARLAGRVAAGRFVEGEARRVAAPSAPVRRQPRADAMLDTEALCGETLRVFDARDGWAWAQLDRDGYVGWLPADALAPPGPEPTHRVTALRAFLFPAPDLKLPPRGALSFGARLALAEEVIVRGTPYRPLAGGDGAVASAAVAPLAAAPAPDFVAVAERFLGIPYLWGGRTSLGIDCSGLVQTALAAAGIAAPRDTDMQQQEVGALVETGAVSAPRRGDLVYWKGHVGILRSPAELLHANAFHMAVAVEPLADALARIGPVLAVRRP